MKLRKPSSFLILAGAAALLMNGTVDRVSARPPQKEVDSAAVAAAAPNVRISRVSNQGVIGDDATIVIRVEWTAQSPRPTTQILEFFASVEVEYADGSKNTGSANVPGSARQADLRVLNKGSNQPRTFKAVVESSFKFLDPNFATRTAAFTLNKSNGFGSAGPSSPPTRPTGDALTIARVRADLNGCGAKDCFTVEWAVGQPRSFTFEQFSIQAEITYNGSLTTNRIALATATGAAVSALLTADKPKVEFLNIVARVTIKGSATVQKRQTTRLAGDF